MTTKHLPTLPDPGRCTGTCCTYFPVVRGSRFYKPDELHEVAKIHPLDAAFVEVLIPIHGPWTEDSPAPRYTCRHLQGNGDCGIYAERPLICREHGVMKKCTTPGCSYAGTKDVAALLDLIRYVAKLRHMPGTDRSVMRLWIRQYIRAVRRRLEIAHPSSTKDQSVTASSG